MEVRDLKLEIWKAEQFITNFIKKFEEDHGILVEDIFFIRENPEGNCGRLIETDMRVLIQGSGFIKRKI